MKELITNKINNFKYNVFIGAHIDDVVLSCGEILSKLTKNEVNIDLVTVFTKSEDPKMLSQFAKKIHADWDLGNYPMEGRKKEDQNATSLFKAKNIYLGELDAIYRKNLDNIHLYSDESKLFGDIAIEDYELIESLADKLQEVLCNIDYDAIYGPLAIGSHVDHRIVRKSLERIIDRRSLYYYEDIPYRFSSSQSEIDMIADHYDDFYINITDDDWKIKLDSIKYYKSQVKSLFGDERNMIKQFSHYKMNHQGNNYCIKFWKRKL